MITYKVEPFHLVIDELLELVVSHWKEVAPFDFDIDPDTETYDLLDKNGLLYIFTARDQGTLIGYCVSMLHPSLHYKTKLFCVNDLLYVKPEYRGTEVSIELLKFLEDVVEEKGVQVITFHMYPNKPFKGLMEMLGYEHKQEMFAKRVGKMTDG